MTKLSEDVEEVRCKQCGKIMGNVTVRSDSQRDLDKIVWINKNIVKCTKCATQR